MSSVYESFCHVLVLETDSRRAGALLKVLAERNLHGTVARDWASLKHMLELHPWKLVFLAADFPTHTGQRDGFGALRLVKSNHPELPVVMLSAADSSQEALKALRCGCVEFIAGLPEVSILGRILDCYLPNHPVATVASPQTDPHLSGPIVGRSAALQRLVRMAASVAPTAAPVMLCGPSGTGKELIGQLIHSRSKRADGPFVRVNCASLSETLLESELFGHEKGAFTGATSQHRGRLERAHGGTLLLDEITETPPAFQAKLLRAMEQMQFERVGGSEQIQVNVRVVSTTNQDIIGLVREGRFRADLYYRLASVRIMVPALSERMEDLGDLIWWFVNAFAHEAGRTITGISSRTLEIFRAYHWPGNIRQLRNIVRTAMILTTGPVLCVTELPWLIDEMRQFGSGGAAGSPAGNLSLDAVERQAILSALENTRGNQTQAAKVLGISDRTLREKVKKYRSTECVTID
jgi:DNA-binding NtrC family response regulator